MEKIGKEQKRIPVTREDEKISDITKEAQKALTATKNKKATGDNELSNNILKAGENSAVSWLTKLFNYA